MATEDYDIDKFIELGKKFKNITPKDISLVANIVDFDFKIASELKRIGFTGSYYICRLKEGINTEISPESRIKTLDNIVKSGLELYYCIEPIEPKHTYEQFVEEMCIAKNYKVGVAAVMRRIIFPGSPIEKYDQISALELIKIIA